MKSLCLATLLSTLIPKNNHAFTIVSQTSGKYVKMIHPIKPFHNQRRKCYHKLASLNASIDGDAHKLSTFAGQVADGMCERFDKQDVKRILESWTLLDKGYEHKEFVGSSDLDPSKSNMHQLCHSYVPNLTCKSFWDVKEFDWCQKLQSKYKIIRKEFLQATKDMETLKKTGNNIWSSALTEDASSYGEGWKTLVLYDRGTWDTTNIQLFPKTTKAIRDSNIPVVEAFFASMNAHTDIKMHSDFTNFVITSHLALDIPESGNNKCRLTVGDDTREWINGEVSLFDTSIMHDAINESDATRYILMLRVWHPDLTEKEQQALQYIYDCLLIPELVSTDPGERFLAEERIKLVKAFPQFKTGAGFGGPKAKSKPKRKR